MVDVQRCRSDAAIRMRAKVATNSTAGYHAEERSVHLLQRMTSPATVYHHKRRLFTCAYCRRVWHFFPDQTGKTAVEVAERFADGDAGEDELRTAYEAANRAGRGITRAAHVTRAAVFAAATYADISFQLSISDFDGGFTAPAKQVLHVIESSDDSRLALESLGALAASASEREGVRSLALAASRGTFVRRDSVPRTAAGAGHSSYFPVGSLHGCPPSPHPAPAKETSRSHRTYCFASVSKPGRHSRAAASQTSRWDEAHP
jgi:hypothetical protein